MAQEDLDLAKELGLLIKSRDEFYSRPYTPEPDPATDANPSARATQLQSTFSQTVADLEYHTFEEFPGKVFAKERKKSVPAPTPVPNGYSPALAQKGIEDLTTALEKATTDKDKLDIALKLSVAVNTQKAYKFDDYKRRAEAEYGVPDILNSIEHIKRAEMTSPSNPGTGVPSRERMDLITSLGAARTHAAQRIREFMATDSDLARAESLAHATIEGIKIGSTIDARQSVADERRMKRDALELAISSVDPNYVAGVAIVKHGNADPSPDQRRAIAEGLVTNKLHLSPIENAVANANPEALKTIYFGARDVKEKELAFRVMAERERAAVGDKQAETNMKLFKMVSDKDMSKIADEPQIAQKYRKRISEINATMAGAGNKEKEAEILRAKHGIQQEYLGSLVQRAFYSDVNNWNGLIKSDDTAKAVLLQSQRDKKPISANEFIGKYLNYNDGKRMDQKSMSLQAIITSGFEAIPRSVVLPVPSPESALLQAQSMIAAEQLRITGMRLFGGGSGTIGGFR